MPSPLKLPLSLAGLAGTLLAIAIWTLLVLASLLAQREQLNRNASALARIDAVANLKKDMAIRKWASGVGGVFIREEHVPSQNSLEEEERFTVKPGTDEQFRIVSVTPIHLLLAIQETSNRGFGHKERLTSNQLRNIGNRPDEWESQALAALSQGAEMVTETQPKKGSHGLMRAMLPMKMEEECLECHRDTLVPVGGLRGGASVSIDLNTYRTAQEPTWRALQYWHGGIWTFGAATILLLHFFSRRRALERLYQDEMRRENEMAFGAMAEGAVITDAEGTILWVNDAFCTIFGFRRDEVIGQNPRILKSGLHDQDFYRQLWHNLTQNGHWRGEIWNRRKNGEIFPEEISMQALRGPDGRIRRYISIFSDITQRKKAEQELADYREHLEELVRQRTEELTVARDQAEAANRSKSTFLANMSHELRTPLNAVIGFSRLMEKDSSLSSRQQGNLEIINHSGHHLLTLINDILELSKIESGKMEIAIEEVALAELLTQVVDMMGLRAEQAGLTLRLEMENLPAVVMLDPVIIRQILLNLLSNAVKFTPQGEIVVRAEAVATGDNRVDLSIAVRDSGIGIAPADCERIFSSFEQVGSNQHGGTGLGLTISRNYVHMLGGELAVESAPGHGSTFHFTIPAQRVDTPQLPARPPEIARKLPVDRRCRVLIVDDGQAARLLVRSLLEPLGFTIDEAANLAEAATALSKTPADLVFLDWYLPDGQGIDFITRLRRDSIDQPRIVMLTANALLEAREAALAAGADDFVSKPFEEGDIFRAIEQQLGICLSSPGNENPPPSDIQEFSRLSPETRKRLTEAAISLSATEIEAALSQVASENPRFAEHLSALCRDRHYQTLWKTLGILDNEQ
ncbi:ATP-binding protein [Dechloromonas denitrificans]|uniref:ATP-binding protein n=1 Tax=Dechloromonas denitrificans TaxID=281362 RepID=UPI000A83A1E0|nr:ATP-binding protein [Dechloromonas denitrificans]